MPQMADGYFVLCIAPRAAMACACVILAFIHGAAPSVPGRARRSVRATGPARVARVRPRAEAESADGDIFQGEAREPDESLIIEPRMTFGLDVHRRIHMRAMRQMAYQAQWRAYCERCVACASASVHARHTHPFGKLTLPFVSKFSRTGQSATGKTA